MPENDTGTTPEEIRAWLAQSAAARAEAIFDFDGHFGTRSPRAQKTLLNGETELASWTAYARESVTVWPKHVSLGPLRQCGECGATLEGSFDGTTIRITSQTGPCPHPDGMPPYSFEINIPSGRLVIANDLREFFPKLEKTQSLNDNVGKRARSLALASLNLAHGFVGNSCPGIFRIAPGLIEIGTDTEEVPHEGERLGYVCTDLWWYSLADLAEVEAGGYSRRDQDTIVEVPRGRYRITHMYHTFDEDISTMAQTFARIEHVPT